MLWGVEGESNATRPILCELLLDGSDQTKIIEGWRAQGIDQATNVANRLL